LGDAIDDSFDRFDVALNMSTADDVIGIERSVSGLEDSEFAVMSLSENATS
jgi:hypothetical protein